MKKTLPEDWKPAEGLKLEDNATAAIKAPGHTLVVAGPGSGKTELLAQKACYLLQTGTSQAPRRILAISFKKDAAFNLKERVKKRCGPDLSQRFDSYTFDKFAKQLVDRFYNAIDEPYRITPDYELLIGPNLKPTIENAFRGTNSNYFYTKGEKFEKFITSLPLPHDETDLDGKMIQSAWLSLTAKKQSKLDLKMIMRLAQFIMDTNPVLKRFLQQTYSYVFLDEFQDTTQLQYDLLKACFDGSAVNYTAVGDDKQMIMQWAGAIPDIFSKYLVDTKAQRLPLTMNFRSAPKLINLQNYLVEHLLQKTDFAQPSPTWKGGAGEARMCFFDDQAGEIAYLVEQIQKWVHTENIPPREICILVKQTPPKYTTDLVDALVQSGVQARDETILQDLLCEEVIQYLIHMLTVIVCGAYGTDSDQAFNFLCNVNSSYDDLPLLKLKSKFIKFLDSHRGRYPKATLSNQELAKLIADIVSLAGKDKLMITFPQYCQGNFLAKTIRDFYTLLTVLYDKMRDLKAALEALQGKDSIPVMTAHKSKGLEYHSVVFIGLEDGAFWTYNDQKEADDNLVFVALSRAKERVLFTFCSNRIGVQKADSIKVIHELLTGSPDVTVVFPQKKV